MNAENVPHLHSTPRGNRVGWGSMVFKSTVAVLLGSVVWCGAQEPIGSIAGLRALGWEQAALGVPVRVTGTVVGIEPAARFHVFIHDGSAGCFVKTHAQGRPPSTAPGDVVRVEGFSDPLGYYPSIRDGRLTVIGKTRLPEPVRPAAADLFSPKLDSEWVEVPAVVVGSESGDDRLTLAVEVHGMPFKAELPLTADAERRAASLMQRPVKLRGIMGTIFNRQRQMTDRHFFVSSLDDVTPTQPPAAGDGAPLLAVGRLLTADLGPDSLVRLRGTVTQTDPKGFYLRDPSGSTLIQYPGINAPPRGTEVEVEGYGAVAPFRPILRATRVERLGPVSDVQPVRLDPVAGDLPPMQSEWVVLDADFLGMRDGAQDGILQFQSGGRFFEAIIPHGRATAHAPAAAGLVAGDHVKLTGICELTTTHALPRPNWVDGFRIHLPATGGITVLHRAPWWNAGRLLAALGLMSGIALIGVLASWMLRRRVKRQMAVISDQLRAEAVAGERDRMARELHDTLEQQLSGVALQLDGLDHSIRHEPQKVSGSLALARRMLRHTRLEARRSVWDLRSKILARDGLLAALRELREIAAEYSGTSIDVSVTGQPRTLPPGVDFHLFRIAQEAVTNAVKHGAAGSVRIHLDYLPQETRLVIRDDGCGFDPANTQDAGHHHFGLLGMRERAGKIGAHLTIDSHPGGGCAVSVVLSTQATHHHA